MIYKFTNFNSSRHISSLEDTCDGVFRFALVEVNLKEPRLYDPDSGFKEILRAVWPGFSEGVGVAGFPDYLGTSIESYLNEQFKLKERIYTVSFLALAAERGKVYISWAGLLRTHLVKNGKVRNITRDHNLVDDPWPNIEPRSDPRLRGLDFYTPTRQLLAVRGPGDRSWESAEWNANDDFEILVCSDSYHKFQAPTDYVFAFSRILDQGNFPEPVVGGGLIAKLEYIGESR